MKSSPITYPSRLFTGLLGCSLALLAATPRARPQDSLIIRTGPSSLSDLYAIDAQTQQSTLLQGALQFLPTTLVGYPASLSLRADLPRPVAGPAPAVRLPDSGSLYRVSQAGSTGLLHARPDGSASLRALTTDAGAPGLLDGLAPDASGHGLLLATDFFAGGSVLWLDLTSDTPPVDLTAGMTPLSIISSTLRLGTDTAWFMAGGQLYVVDLALPSTPQAVSLPLLPGEVLVPDLALAGDGASVALVAQTTPARRRLFVVHKNGTVTTVHATPTTLATPSLNAVDGPLVALSSDGSCVAWRATLLTRELFVQRLDVPSAPTQVTADVSFTDTIDNVGILGFVGPALLFFAAGEVVAPTDPAVALDAADVYVTDTSTGSLANVSVSSGQASAPFLVAGDLKLRFVRQTPSGDRLLLDVDPQGGDDLLLSVPLDGSTGLTTLLPDLNEAPLLQPVGDALLIASLADQQVGPALRELHLLPVGGALQALASLPGSIILDRFASRRDGSVAALVASTGPNLELVAWIDVPSATVLIAWPQILGVSAALGFGPGGELLAGLGLSGGPYLFAGFDQPGSGSLLSVPKGDGFPLSP